MKSQTVKTLALSVLCSMFAVSGSAVAGKSQTECIKLAMANGYGDEHCASLFIETCMETSSRSELNRVYQYDMGSLGYGRSTMCGPKGNPNGQRYSEEWNRIKNANDKW